MITIVDSTAFHARELAKNIRQEDQLEAQRQGVNPVKGLFQSYRKGLYRKTGLIDGKVAAMWGVCGTLLGTVGVPYLVTSDLVKSIPSIRFARIYLSEVQKMRKMFPVLANYVDAEYTDAVRLLEIAGFKLEGTDVIKDSVFYKFSMVGE